jgi:hypothetical protein
LGQDRRLHSGDDQIEERKGAEREKETEKESLSWRLWKITWGVLEGNGIKKRGY